MRASVHGPGRATTSRFSSTVSEAKHLALLRHPADAETIAAIGRQRIDALAVQRDFAALMGGQPA